MSKSRDLVVGALLVFALGAAAHAQAKKDEPRKGFNLGRAATAQEQVLRALRSLIASGTLEPGQQVVQDALAAQLGVSRVPLREALKVLEGEGQVVYHPHRGYFVAELSAADLSEVYRIRQLLEDEAVSIAIPNLSEVDVAAIERASVELELPTAIEMRFQGAAHAFRASLSSTLWLVLAAVVTSSAVRVRMPVAALVSRVKFWYPYRLPAGVALANSSALTPGSARPPRVSTFAVSV